MKNKKREQRLGKLARKLEKLNKEMYDNNKHVTREEFLVSKLSKRLKAYYNTLSPEKRDRFIKYILDDEQWWSNRETEMLDRTQDEVLCSTECSSVSELIKCIKKERKKRRKMESSKKNVLKTDDGLLLLLNPEAYDQTLLSDKKYRKYLKKVAEEERRNMPVELDCTLKNFKKELMTNKSVNAAITDGFWNKHGL